jgi:hypothetical protein
MYYKYFYLGGRIPNLLKNRHNPGAGYAFDPETRIFEPACYRNLIAVGPKHNHPGGQNLSYAP